MPRELDDPASGSRRDLRSRPRRDSISRPHKPDFKRALGHVPNRALPGVETLLHVSFLEALPQLLKLLRLLWALAPGRTVIMLVGNFTKSLLPAADLRIRAELIEIINSTIRKNRAFRGNQIGRLLVLQLISIIFRNYLSAALSDNQQYVNAKLTAVLKRKLMETHLRLDTAALQQPETQRLLADAVNMSSPGALGSLVSITFNLTNSITDITARIAATSRTISLDALPYFLLYSFVPVFRIAYSRLAPLTHITRNDEADVLRRNDLASIAFDLKSRREVALLNLQDYIAKEYTDVEQRLQETTSPRIRGFEFMPRFMEVLTSFSNPAIYSFLAWRSQTTDISLADLHLIENTTTGLIGTADRAIQTQTHSSHVLSNLINYYKALDLKPALPMVDEPIIYTPDKDLGMKIEFQNVSFRYSSEGPLVLENVSFTILPGQVAALVGYNGSGKSTLIALLARVYDPTEGRILINDNDLKHYDLDSLSHHMSFTHQDFARWPLTGFENVAVGDIDGSNRTSVEEAARATGAFDVLDAKNESLSTTNPSAKTDGVEAPQTKLWDQRLSKMTSEMLAAQADNHNAQISVSRRGIMNRPRMRNSGIELSGGQWAKVALSRSFLRKGDFLVLDEPSANLDPQAEHNLFTNLLKIRSGRTILFITHRLGVVRASDNILFLDRGQLVEQGSHELLMQREGGMYRHLVDLQTDGFSRQ